MITDSQIERLEIAYKTMKYGHLETWQELYYFQRGVATSIQNQEIAGFATRKLNGKNITLPLKDFV